MRSLKKLLNIGNLYIFFYVFSIFKHSKTMGKLHWIALLPLCLICTVFVCLILIVAAIYFEIVNFILKLKHGDDYFGIIDGSDLIWVVEEGSFALINIILMIDAKDGEGVEPLFEFMQNNYKNICETHDKMSCVRRYFMGYWYFLKTRINIQECVKYLDEYKDVEGLNLLLDKLSDSPLPDGNTALWEVYIGRVPIKWKKNDDKLQYPIFIKYHHSLGDGISIITLMTTQFMENGVNIMKEKCKTYGNILKKAAASKTSKTTFLENIKKIFTKNYITYFAMLEDAADKNKLHRKTLSHEKHVCYSIEKDSTNYVEKVKSIKNRVKGISFNDVIISAFSASCDEYYMAHDENPPEKIRLAITYYIASPNFENVVTTGSNGEIVTKLKNNFALSFLNLRMNDKDIARNLLDRLMSVNKDSQISKDSLDFPFMFWQMDIFASLIPYPIIEMFVKTNRTTLILTNVPGLNTSYFISGHKIRDILTWPPNFLNCGISFSIFTFDGLIRLGLLVDKETIKERSEVQQICDNVFKYIDMLDTMTKNENILNF